MIVVLTEGAQNLLCYVPKEGRVTTHIKKVVYYRSRCCAPLVRYASVVCKRAGTFIFEAIAESPLPVSPLDTQSPLSG